MPGTVAGLCKVPKRRPEAVEQSLRDAVGRGLYEGSQLLERIRSGETTYRVEAERMIREELEQAVRNAECAALIVKLPTIRKASKPSKASKASKPSKPSKPSKAAPVAVVESVKASPVVVPIRPGLPPVENPALSAEPIRAYLARLVYAPKRDYCEALVRGERPADPGTDWARKARERLRAYGLEV